MTWLTGKQYLFSFSLFPRLCAIKDGWNVKLIIDNIKTIDEPIFERKVKINKYKILIREQIDKNKLKLIQTIDIKTGDIIKIDIDVPNHLEYLIHFEVIDVDRKNNIITLNRDILHKIDLTFIERSPLTGIYYFNFTPQKPGFYNFEISNPKHFIKPFGITIEVKDKLYIQELIETYTEELNKKFRIENIDPSDPPTGVSNSIWFNKTTGKIWIWNGKKWITAD